MRIPIHAIAACISIGVLCARPEGAVAEVSVSETINPSFAALVAERELAFEQVPEIGGNSPTELINGVVVDRANFPGIFRMTTGGTCTAALVGPTAILTAAHCIDHGAKVRFVTDDVEVRAICERATGYVENVAGSEDFALCLLERAITGILYETIDVGAMPAAGEELVLTGYGCTAQGGPLDGELRVGPARAVDRPDVSWLPVETSTIYTDALVDTGGTGTAGAILCPGDSGGPLFRFFGPNVGDSRVIVGVNSRTTYEFGVSLFAATGSRQGRLWLTYWADRHEAEVCGINRDEDCI